MPVVPKINFSNTAKQSMRRLIDLRENMVMSAATGRYKEYKKSSIEYAGIAVNNYDLLKYLPKPSSVKVPLFSKSGLRMAKVWFLDMFRVKTPEEKLLKKMGTSAKLEQEANKYIH